MSPMHLPLSPGTANCQGSRTPRPTGGSPKRRQPRPGSAPIRHRWHAGFAIQLALTVSDRDDRGRRRSGHRRAHRVVAASRVGPGAHRVVAVPGRRNGAGGVIAGAAPLAALLVVLAVVTAFG